jgi:hypothetical protein
MGEKGTSHKVLVEKPVGKRPIRRHICIWEVISK